MKDARPVLAALVLCCLAGAGGADANREPRSAAARLPARELIAAALEAMGGAELLRSLGVVRTEGLEVVDELASHDLPGMPLQQRVFQFTELRDPRRGRRRYEATEVGFPSPFTTAIVMNRDVAMRTFDGKPGSDFLQMLWGLPALQQSTEALALAPEELLLSALEHGPQTAGETTLEGRPAAVVELRLQGAPVRLFIDRETHLPAAVEITRELPYESFYGELGPLTTRTRFASWWAVPGGLRYPREWRTWFRGQLQRVTTIDKIELNAPAAEDSFAIPDAIAGAFRSRTVKSIEDYPLGRPPGQGPSIQEVAPGVVFIPGWMNVVLVAQDDGVVVVEAPISSGYSARVIAEAGRRFPGARVKAAISTSDAPVHFGGVREYAARGIPIYLRDANLASLTALLQAPHRAAPDAYARAPRRPELRAVSARLAVGSGPNRIEIYPVHVAGGERSLMVYLPQRRLLYAADMPVTNRGRPFPFHSFTVAGAAAQAHLDVDQVLGIHPGPTPWKEVEGVKPE